MQQLKIIFDKYEDAIEVRRDIKSIIRDALEGSEIYQKVKEKLEEAKAEVKRVEETIKADYAKELDQFEKLEEDIKNNREIMTEVALDLFKNGQPVVVKDKYNQEYEGIFKVKFEKIK